MQMNSNADPWEIFSSWLKEASENSLFSPDAVALATVSAQRRPSLRMVFFRGIREHGLSFFTNFESGKGKELDINPKAAMLFYWPHLKRQIRVEGTVARLSNLASDEYFARRPLESQITASVSKQSRPLSSYEEFERELKDFKIRNEARPISRPENWGGYALTPAVFEFWIGQSHRRHRRQRFKLSGSGWSSELLYP